MRRSPFALAATTAAFVSSAGMMAASGVARAAPLAEGAEAGRADGGDGGTAARAADLPATATHRVLGLEGALAVRGNRITSPSFDAFSSSDALVESTLAASYWFARTPALGVAAGVEWSHGAVSSNVRGTASSLDVDGLALTLKGSLPLGRRWAVFGRLAPGVVHLDARLREDSAVPVPGAPGTPALARTKWLPSIDVAAGAAFCVGSVSGGPRALEFRYWLTAEGGYGYSPSYELTLGGAGTPTAGRSDQPVKLGNLSVRGGFMRFGFATTF